MKTELNQISAIATISIKEALRNRTFLILFLSALALFTLSQLLGNMATGGRERVMMSTGFWGLGFWGLISAILFGSGAVTHEIRQKTLYMILARGVPRSTFILGKYTGLVMSLTLLYFSIALVFVLLLYLAGFTPTPALFITLVFILFEWIILCSFSLFFATFTSPVLSGFFLGSLYIIGHWGRSFFVLAQNTDNLLVKKFILYLYYVLPNLEVINFRSFAINNEIISMDFIWQGGVMTLGWSAAMLVASIFIFNLRRLQ